MRWYRKSFLVSIDNSLDQSSLGPSLQRTSPTSPWPRQHSAVLWGCERRGGRSASEVRRLRRGQEQTRRRQTGRRMNTWQILMNSDDIGTIRIDISYCWFLRRSSKFHRFDIFDDYGWTMMNTLTCWWVPTRGFLNRFNTHQYDIIMYVYIWHHDIISSNMFILKYNHL